MYRFFVWNYLNSKKFQFSNLDSPGPILNFYMWFCRNFPELLEFRNCYSNLGQGDRNPKFFYSQPSPSAASWNWGSTHISPGSCGRSQAQGWIGCQRYVTASFTQICCLSTLCTGGIKLYMSRPHQTTTDLQGCTKKGPKVTQVIWRLHYVPPSHCVSKWCSWEGAVLHHEHAETAPMRKHLAFVILCSI